MRTSLDATARAFARGYPEAEVVNILDDSLSVDVEMAGNQDERMLERFSGLGEYARRHARADAILFTCSAFGTAIERVQRENQDMPVLKPNAAMQLDIVSRGGTVGLLSIFGPTLASIENELSELSRHVKPSPGLKPLVVIPRFIGGALDALRAGDEAKCAALIANDAINLLESKPEVSTLALAMFSMAFAKSHVESKLAQHMASFSARSCIPVLTSPDSAVKDVRMQLSNAAP
ncbi:hypothetical protein FVE85_1995 [Porphyridium purpureum]|uniref:Arylsulfatase n=1 Tax=Porphyridium purpureum TaxID=35688 RepID=A0A5J4YY06_PORPP|nr:hypothetical protein FVE85_1995 [Porphyridium purpureum]|eukprot:POR3783..scf209_3